MRSSPPPFLSLSPKKVASRPSPQPIPSWLSETCVSLHPRHPLRSLALSRLSSPPRLTNLNCLPNLADPTAPTTRRNIPSPRAAPATPSRKGRVTRLHQESRRCPSPLRTCSRPGHGNLRTARTAVTTSPSQAKNTRLQSRPEPEPGPLFLHQPIPRYPPPSILGPPNPGSPPPSIVPSSHSDPIPNFHSRSRPQALALVLSDPDRPRPRSRTRVLPSEPLPFQDWHDHARLFSPTDTSRTSQNGPVHDQHIQIQVQNRSQYHHQGPHPHPEHPYQSQYRHQYSESDRDNGSADDPKHCQRPLSHLRAYPQNELHNSLPIPVSAIPFRTPGPRYYHPRLHHPSRPRSSPSPNPNLNQHSSPSPAPIPIPASTSRSVGTGTGTSIRAPSTAFRTPLPPSPALDPVLRVAHFGSGLSASSIKTRPYPRIDLAATPSPLCPPYPNAFALDAHRTPVRSRIFAQAQTQAQAQTRGGSRIQGYGNYARADSGFGSSPTSDVCAGRFPTSFSPRKRRSFIDTLGGPAPKFAKYTGNTGDTRYRNENFAPGRQLWDDHDARAGSSSSPTYVYRLDTELEKDGREVFLASDESNESSEPPIPHFPFRPYFQPPLNSTLNLGRRAGFDATSESANEDGEGGRASGDDGNESGTSDRRKLRTRWRGISSRAPPAGGRRAGPALRGPRVEMEARRESESGVGE
ncbi:hypothetical protein BOTBODRAFT_190688, partial [Botryobasidium botryosum FD-172 SS1]